MTMPLGEDSFRCDICAELFQDECNLGRRTINAQFVIPSMSYLYNSQLKAHMLIHTGEKNYQCTVCDTRYVIFIQQSTESTYVNSHWGEELSMHSL